MKKPLALFALLCALLLSGCQTALLPRDAAARAQRVEIADAAAGESLDVLESERSLEAFVEALKLEDWQMAELPLIGGKPQNVICTQAVCPRLSGFER